MNQEKPWWDLPPFLEEIDEESHDPFVCKHEYCGYDVEKIVAEAKRRGKLSAWEDAHRLASLDGKDQSWLLAQVNAKIAILEAL